MKKIKYLLFTIAIVLVSTPVVYAGEYTKYIQCGSSSLPAPIPGITRAIVLLLQIVLPIIVIVMGSIDFMKAVGSSDPEKIKNGQKQFIKRITAAVIFFLVITIVRLAVTTISNIANEDKTIAQCISCLIDSESECGEITNDGPFGPADYGNAAGASSTKNGSNANNSSENAKGNGGAHTSPSGGEHGGGGAQRGSEGEASGRSSGGKSR